jgi:hypothetical protein
LLYLQFRQRPTAGPRNPATGFVPNSDVSVLSRHAPAASTSRDSKADSNAALSRAASANRYIRLALAADARKHRRTACPDLWIRRLGVRIPPGEPASPLARVSMSSWVPNRSTNAGRASISASNSSRAWASPGQPARVLAPLRAAPPNASGYRDHLLSPEAA